MKHLKLIICLFVFISAINGIAQNNLLKICSIPFPLEIKNIPNMVETRGDSILMIASSGKTNLFVSPNGKYNVQNAPMVLFKPDDNFVFQARVSAPLDAIYDVAALVFYQDSAYWGKFCFENSVDKKTTIVSVINRHYSDDCNSKNIEADYAYMAMIKRGMEMSFHYSSNGNNWEMIRNFRLGTEKELKIGFAVHGSRGDGLEAQFSEIKYSSKVPENLRSF